MKQATLLLIPSTYLNLLLDLCNLYAVNMLLHTPLFVALALWCDHAVSQVVGKATGMATGTTGGGSATPAVPSSLAE